MTDHLFPEIGSNLLAGIDQAFDCLHRLLEHAALGAVELDFDHTLDPRRSVRRLAGLPGLDGVHTAGAVLGMDSGFDDLVDLAAASPGFAALAIAADGVRAEHVPWLVRAGVTRVHLGAAVRPGSSWTKSYVDAGFVRSWRLLLNSATDNQSGADVADAGSA